MTIREQSKGEQRERILAAARALFAERGMEQVTMSEVAAASGVARATVFNYFASKYALAEAITEEVIAYFSGMLERALADETTPTPTLIRAFFAHMGTGIEAYASFFRGVFREIVKIWVGLDEGGAAQRARAGTFAQLEALMARGLERGELQPLASAADLARAFDSLTNGTIVHWLYDEPGESLAARMERTSEIFLGAVAAARFATAPRRLVALAPLPQDPIRKPTPRRRARPRPRRAKES